MVTGRFTFVGLAIVGLGWMVLAAAMVLSQVFLTPGNMVAVLSWRGDIVTVAQTAILSGFALALLGALREGFGALNRFFEAVLQRSTAPRPAPVVEPMAEPVMASPMPTPSVSIEPLPQKGRLKDRNYVILANGSVEVETLLGTRVFASLDEARDFIR